MRLGNLVLYSVEIVNEKLRVQVCHALHLLVSLCSSTTRIKTEQHIREQDSMMHAVTKHANGRQLFSIVGSLTQMSDRKQVDDNVNKSNRGVQIRSPEIERVPAQNSSNSATPE